jgi:translation initiation factor 1
MAMRKNARVVYSTGVGRVCPGCGRPSQNCRCSTRQAEEPVPVRVVAKLRIEKAGRNGKTVTVVYGLTRKSAFLDDLGRELKHACGVGGTIQDEAIELQGNLRDRVREFLLKKGFGVKG